MTVVIPKGLQEPTSLFVSANIRSKAGPLNRGRQCGCAWRAAGSQPRRRLDSPRLLHSVMFVRSGGRYRTFRLCCVSRRCVSRCCVALGGTFSVHFSHAMAGGAGYKLRVCESDMLRQLEGQTHHPLAGCHIPYVVHDWLARQGDCRSVQFLFGEAERS